jgi:hypothetical protein
VSQDMRVQLPLSALNFPLLLQEIYTAAAHISCGV